MYRSLFNALCNRILSFVRKCLYSDNILVNFWEYEREHKHDADIGPLSQSEVITMKSSIEQAE